MQERHHNRKIYFEELAATSRKYFIPYISRRFPIKFGMSILEIGCGDGGILLPFAELGCKTLGVDLSSNKIDNAIAAFKEHGTEGNFIAMDIFKYKMGGVENTSI